MRRLFAGFFGLFVVLTSGLAAGKHALPPKDMPFTGLNKWALVIGANEYEELGRLRFATRDAKDFAALLEERFEFEQEALELLTDASDSKAKPTREGISAALDRLLGDPRMKQGDLFILYFSGHGIGTSKGDFLMPTNATKANAEAVGYPVKDIIRRFVDAGLRNVLFVVDACRGGEKNPFGEDLRKLGRQANIAVLLSCEPGTRSYEYTQLGHGAFTSFLIKALKDPALVSELTGGLWATRVAAEVKQKVSEYTVRDYPDQPQSPTGWSEGTMDVLLGAFPTKGKARPKLADLQAETERLDRAVYLNSLRTYADDIFSDEDFAGAVEIWRLLDGIEKLGAMERFNMAMALSFMGRTTEMENEFAKIAAGDSEDLFTWLGVVYNPSRKIKPTERVAAAKKAWALARHEWVSMIVWASLQTHASDADVSSFLKEALKEDDLSPRMRSFFVGWALANTGDWAGAYREWERTKGVEGTHPDAGTIAAYQLQALQYQGKTDELEGFLKSAVATVGAEDASWNLLLANYYKELQKPELAIPIVKQALSKQIEPSELLWALRIAGINYRAVAAEVAKRADEFPFAWKAMLAKGLAKMDDGPDAVEKALAEALKFSDDEFQVLYESVRVLDVALSEAFQLGRLEAQQYANLLLAYAQSMAENVEQFGYDAEVWILFNSLALGSEKLEQAYALYEHYLGPRLKDGTLDPTLYAPYLIVALQMDDAKRVDELWNSGRVPGTESVDAGWSVSMFRALKGELSLARKLLPAKLPAGELVGVARGYQAWLDVREGKKPDLEKLESELVQSPGGTQWLALAYVQLNQWEQALPLMERSVLQRQMGFYFVQARVAELYHRRLLENKKLDEANELAYAMGSSGFGNPIYKRIHYGSEAKVAAFAGKIELEAIEFSQLPEMTRGDLELVIAADGTVTGRSKQGDKERKIAGKVDQYGNLVATLGEGNVAWKMTGKIAPPKLYATLDLLKEQMQAFLLLDSKGQGRFLMGKLKAGSSFASRLSFLSRVASASR